MLRRIVELVDKLLRLCCGELLRDVDPAAWSELRPEVCGGRIHDGSIRQGDIDLSELIVGQEVAPELRRRVQQRSGRGERRHEPRDGRLASGFRQLVEPFLGVDHAAIDLFSLKVIKIELRQRNVVGTCNEQQLLGPPQRCGEIVGDPVCGAVRRIDRKHKGFRPGRVRPFGHAPRDRRLPGDAAQARLELGRLGIERRLAGVERRLLGLFYRFDLLPILDFRIDRVRRIVRWLLCYHRRPHQQAKNARAHGISPRCHATPTEHVVARTAADSGQPSLKPTLICC